MAEPIAVESLARHDYSGISRPPGTIYAVQPEHVGVLIGLGLVRRAPASDADVRKAPRQKSAR